MLFNYELWLLYMQGPLAPSYPNKEQQGNDQIAPDVFYNCISLVSGTYQGTLAGELDYLDLKRARKILNICVATFILVKGANM